MALSGNLGQGQRTFDQLVVLGDSLSDMGNAGRFSDGPVWIAARPVTQAAAEGKRARRTELRSRWGSH
jgi:hypothetical protein